MNNTKRTIVNENLEGKRVFITGCTGFLGKVLLEKIIRSISGVASIHLLVRGNSKYKTGKERFNAEIATSSVFNRLKSEDLEAFELFCDEKIHVVTGELTEENFGLNQAEFSSLSKKIDIIVNSAASVNFREELDKALKINTLCLENIVALSNLGGNIPVVQVSTCFVHGFNKGEIHEEVMAPIGKDFPQDDDGNYIVAGVIEKLQQAISKIKSNNLDEESLKNNLVEFGIEQSNNYGWNDTYTFTKWMGEQLLIEKLKGRSLSILRPAVIESTVSEPVPGWIEGVKVADAVIFAYARGKISYFPSDPNGVIDIVPADLVANGVILAMTKVFTSPGQLNIYQSCSRGSDQPVTRELVEYLIEETQENYKKYPKLLKGKKPADSFHLVSKTIFSSVVKALDVSLNASQRFKSLFGFDAEKTSFHKNVSTALQLSTVFSFYGFPNYRFKNDKLLALANELGENVNSEFNVDPSDIDWKQYFGKTHIAGIEQYALKESKVYSMKKSRKDRKRKAA